MDSAGGHKKAIADMSSYFGGNVGDGHVGDGHVGIAEDLEVFEI